MKLKYSLPKKEPDYPCFLGCGAILRSKYGPKAEGWDWFTGHGDKTMHFCPACQLIGRKEIGELREIVFMKPQPPEKFVKVSTAREMLRGRA